MAESGRIFICYRREETAYSAGWLFDRLADRFGGQIFKDVDSIEPGDDWVEVITAVVGGAASMTPMTLSFWRSRLPCRETSASSRFSWRGPGCREPMSCRRAWQDWPAARLSCSARPTSTPAGWSEC